jgi:hypothetical protein
MKLVVLFVSVAIAVWLAPLLAIWSLNTLFKAGIGYGFAEWFAALVLMATVSGPKGSGK